MKKSIIALAVAGALTAPMTAQADRVLYNIPFYDHRIYTKNDNHESWKGNGKQRMRRAK